MLLEEYSRPTYRGLLTICNLYAIQVRGVYAILHHGMPGLQSRPNNQRRPMQVNSQVAVRATCRSEALSTRGS